MSLFGWELSRRCGGAALIAVIVVVVLPVTVVDGQYGMDWNTMNCDEKRGAITAVRTIVYGGMMGTEGQSSVDPGAQQLMNGLTRILLEMQQDYDVSC